MNEKVVLIDGHSILNRAFYGVPDLTNSEGLHTNAVYGFINIMLKIIDTEKPDYLTVAFDVKKPTFRHEMYKEYKGTRKPMPEELRQQVPVIQDVLKAMGVTLVMQGGLEADDILGTLAKRAEKDGRTVTIVSGDRDLLQLASDKIKISIPKNKKGGSEVENYNTNEVIEKYSITPSQVVDMKGLMGDTADNIPGVPGVGEKTALKILTAFPTVEEAYEHIEEVEPKRARELLRANKELAFLSKKLATIKTDCELDYDFEQAKTGSLFTPEAFEWIKKLELKSLIKKFDTETISTAVAQPSDFKYLDNIKDIDAFVKKLLSSGPEVVGISFWGDEWSNSGTVIKKSKKKTGGQLSFIFDEEGSDVSIGESENTDTEYLFGGISISYENADKVNTVSIIKTEDITGDYLIDIYRKIASKVKHIALMDWKNTMHLTAPVKTLSPAKDAPSQKAFDDESLDNTHKLFRQIFDVNIAAYLLNPLKDTYMVDDIARDYLSLTIPSYVERFQKKTMTEIVGVIEDESIPDDEKEVLKKNLLEYISDMAYVSCLACSRLMEELKAQKMYDLFVEIEMPTAYYLYQMEKEGVRADKDELASMSKLLDEKIKALETDIYDIAGEEFNINSPKQLGIILFEKMKLPFAKKTKTGYSTSADILEKLRNEDPIVSKILDYRQVSKLKSTYADGLAVYIESDNRIHGKFNQTITATGRISSTEPNLQNIPIRMELGRQLRKVFKPKDGYVFLDADYSQIELRVLAHMSDDDELKEAYIEGQDIHRSTAAKVFHTPFEEVTDLQRRNAKAVNFGIVYGISAFGLSQDIGVSRKEADEIIKQYFATYPAIKSFLDGMVQAAKDKGYSETMFGRRRPVPEINSSNFMQKSFGERIAMNSPIQGTAADIIKIAMIKVAERIRKENLRSRIVLQVHDELLVETLESEKDEMKKILVEEMQSAVELSIPLIAEVEEGRNWFEAH